jgi:hypothetical protein
VQSIYLWPLPVVQETCTIYENVAGVVYPVAVDIDIDHVYHSQRYTTTNSLTLLTNALLLNPRRGDDFGVKLDEWVQLILFREPLEVLLDLWSVSIEAGPFRVAFECVSSTISVQQDFRG